MKNEIVALRAPIARILARYIAGAIGALGLAGVTNAEFLGESPELIDIIQLAVGGILTVTVEWVYYLANKRGWTK